MRQSIASHGRNGALPAAGACRQNPEVQIRCEDERGAVLLDPRSGQVRGLNATGLFIWRLCDGKRDVPSLVAALCQTFEDVPEDVVTEQVVSFLEALCTAGLVCFADGQRGSAGARPWGDGLPAGAGERPGEQPADII